MSRRSFLSLSAKSAALGAISSPLLGSGFRVVQRGAAVHVLVGEEPRWIINPAAFDGRPHVGVSRGDDKISIRLEKARFAATNVSADFECIFSRSHGVWMMDVVADSGFTVRAKALPWLQGRENAIGKMTASQLNPFTGFSIRFARGLPVEFAPDWTLRMIGPLVAQVDGVSANLCAGFCHLNLCTASQLAAETGVPATSFVLDRGDSFWGVSLARSSHHQGWSLQHDPAEELFSALHVEAARGQEGALHTALFLPPSEDTGPSLSLLPTENLICDTGETFALALRRPRLAFTLGESATSSALVADISEEERWAHGPGASYLLSGHPEGGKSRRFELLEDALSADSTVAVDAAVAKISFPADEFSATLVLHQPRTFLPGLTAPFERLWGLLSLMPSEHEKPFVLLQEDTLHIDRPRDFLSLKFKFDNMSLIPGLDPRVKAAGDTTAKARISVIFPPQHIGEEAIFHDDDPSKTCASSTQESVALPLDQDDWKSPQPPTPTTSVDPDRPAKVRMAGESRLVFNLPDGEDKVPLHLEALLDWSGWQPVIAESAQTTATTGKPAPMEARDDPAVTSIEIPWQLHLSPSEHGRWAHSLIPVSHGENAVELWHTRLGVEESPVAKATRHTELRIDDITAYTTQPLKGEKERSRLEEVKAEIQSALHSEETKSKDRTVRAIWTESLAAGPDAWPVHYNPTLGDVEPNDPFLMSLDARDKVELVHLTTDYKMPVGLPPCSPGSKPPTETYRTPLPVNVNRMILTGLGGYLDSIGKWDPGKLTTTHQLEVQEWAHVATLGRDQYVRVVYKGYLLPFGHPASLVKITERRLARRINGPGYYATLHQRIFIVVQNPICAFPTLGQKFAGREIAFNTVEAITLVTPNLAPPTGVFPGSKLQQSQDLFWPSVDLKCTEFGGSLSTPTPFKFRFRFHDFDRNTPEAELPVMFAGASVAQGAGSGGDGSPANPYLVGDAIAFYSAGSNKTETDEYGEDSRITADFGDQRVTFAPAHSPGDTQYITRSIGFRVDDFEVPGVAPNPCSDLYSQLYQKNLPYFFPAINFLFVQSPTVQHIGGSAPPAKTAFYPTYLQFGFDPTKNSGEVFLKVQGDMPQLAFGASGKVDQSGGLASPDVKIAGYSRKGGPIGGRDLGATPRGQDHPALASFSTGTFDPSQFFGGLISARILGSVKLSDIIAPIASGVSSNLAKAPQMLEQAVHDVVQVARIFTDPAVKYIDKFQALVPNPVAAYLAPQVSAVDAASQAVDAYPNDSDIEAGILEGQLVARIIEYGQALLKIIEQPQGIAEQFLLEQFTPDAPTIAAILASIQTLSDAVSSTLAKAVADFQTQFTAFASFLYPSDPAKVITLADQIPKPSVAGQLRVFSDLIPDLAALIDLVDAAKDFALQVNGLANPKNTDPLQSVPERLGYLSAAFADALTIYQRAGVLGIVSDNSGQQLNRLHEAQDRTRTFLAKVAVTLKDATTAPSLLKFNTDCLNFAGLLQTANKPGRDVLKELRVVQRCADQMSDCLALIAQPANLALRDLQRLLALLRTLQHDILAALAAVQSIALTIDTAGDLKTAADLVNTDAQDLASRLTVASLLATAGNDYDVLRSDLVFLGSPAAAGQAARPPHPFSGALGVTYADIDKRVKNLQNTIGASAADLGLKLTLFNTAFEADIPLAAAAQWEAFGFDPTAPATVRKTVNDLASYITAFNDALSAITVAAADATKSITAVVCMLSDPWKKLHAGLPALVSAPMANSLTNVDKAFDTLCKIPPTGPADAITTVRGVALAFVALMSDIRQQILGGSLAVQAVVAEARTLLPTLLENLPVPVSISISYDWHPDLQNFEPIFILREHAEFTVSAKATIGISLADGSPTKSIDIQATLTNFTLNLIGDPSFLIVNVESLQFTSVDGQKPDCRLSLKGVEFGEDLGFVKELADLLDPKDGPFIELSEGGIRAGYRFAIESIPVGTFLLMQLAFEVAVALPFNGDPVRCEFGISDEMNPFLLIETIYCGGGYLQLELGLDGVQALEGALEFGIASDISIGPLIGKGYLVAGIYFRIAGTNSRVCGFVHAHGVMDIYGLIQITVDLYVGTCYDSDTRKVTGIARFSVNVSVLFFSETFEMEAQYSFGGSGSSPSTPAVANFAYPGALDLTSRAGSPSPNDVDTFDEDAEPDFVTEKDWSTYFNYFAA